MKLSVIIATHQRPRSLARLLSSLTPQLGSQERELIVADNGSAEPTSLLPLPGRLLHLHEPQRGKCRIQNRAIAAAQGEILVFLDDDVFAAANHLDQVEAFFASHPEFAAMKGRILPAEDPEAIAGEKAAYLDLPISDHGERVVEVRGVVGANMAFRASTIKAVGPFDERLGPGASGHEEETEMSTRIRRAGLRIGYAPLAVVYHEVDPARASRSRFLTVARERGRCRMLHEFHSTAEVLGKCATAYLRLKAARAIRCRPERIAREERRLAIARGMFDGLGSRPPRR